MSHGIGSYFRESEFRRVPVSGVGAYYAPEPLSPVEAPQPGFAPLVSTNGLGSGPSDGTKAFLAILGLVILGYFFTKD